MAYWSLTVLTVMAAFALLRQIPSTNTELVVGLGWIFGTVLILYFGNNAAEAFANIKKR